MVSFFYYSYNNIIIMIIIIIRKESNVSESIRRVLIVRCSLPDIEMHSIMSHQMIEKVSNFR